MLDLLVCLPDSELTFLEFPVTAEYSSTFVINSLTSPINTIDTFTLLSISYLDPEIEMYLKAKLVRKNISFVNYIFLRKDKLIIEKYKSQR